MKILAVFFLIVSFFSNVLMAAQPGNVTPADLRAQLVLQKKEFLRLSRDFGSVSGRDAEAGQVSEYKQLIPGMAANVAVAKILFRPVAPSAGFLGIDLPVAFFPGAGKKASEALDLAIAYLEYGLVDEALQRFSELLKSSHSEQLSDTTLYYQALAYQELGQFAAAENVLRQACPGVSKQSASIAKRCRDKRVPLLLVDQLIKQERLSKAAALLQELGDASSAYVKTAFRLHSAQYQASQRGVAINGLELLSKIDSGDPETHRYQDRINVFLGYNYLENGQPEMAKAVFHRVNLHAEKASQALLGLGMAEWSLGKEQAALTFWKRIETTSVARPLLMRSAGLMIAYAQWQLGFEKKASASYRDAIIALKKESRQIKLLRRTINGRNLQSLLARNKNTRGEMNARDSVAESLKNYLNNLYSNPQFAMLIGDYKSLMEVSTYVVAVIAMPASSRNKSLSLDDFVRLQKNVFQLRMKYEQKFRYYLNAEFDAQQKIVDADIVEASYFQARLIDSMLSLGDKR